MYINNNHNLIFNNTVRNRHLIEGSEDDTLKTKEIERRNQKREDQTREDEKEELEQKEDKKNDFDTVLEDFQKENPNIIIEEITDISQLENITHTFNPHMDTMTLLNLIKTIQKK